MGIKNHTYFKVEAGATGTFFLIPTLSSHGQLSVSIEMTRKQIKASKADDSPTVTDNLEIIS